jgi:hypothetical protein
MRTTTPMRRTAIRADALHGATLVTGDPSEAAPGVLPEARREREYVLWSGHYFFVDYPTRKFAALNQLGATPVMSTAPPPESASCAPPCPSLCSAWKAAFAVA